MCDLLGGEEWDGGVWEVSEKEEGVGGWGGVCGRCVGKRGGLP